jgi:hypothetical protein
MSKTFCNSLQAMSADQATEKLGEYLEKVILNLTDKNIGQGCCREKRGTI